MLTKRNSCLSNRTLRKSVFFRKTTHTAQIQFQLTVCEQSSFRIRGKTLPTTKKNPVCPPPAGTQRPNSITAAETSLHLLHQPEDRKNHCTVEHHVAIHVPDRKTLRVHQHHTDTLRAEQHQPSCGEKQSRWIKKLLDVLPEALVDGKVLLTSGCRKRMLKETVYSTKIIDYQSDRKQLQVVLLTMLGYRQ